MGRKILAICDSEPVYARNLMECICMEREVSLQVRVFSDAGQLFQYGKKHPIDLLLMEDRYPPDMRKKIKAKRRFLLAGDALQQPLEDEAVILKYQSARQILSQLLAGHEKEFSAGREKAAGAVRGKLIGVYSPVHRIGKTRFALKLAQELGGRAPALYLNLEEYSGMEYCLPMQAKGDLGDLLYFAGQEKGSFGLRLSAMACRLGSADYVQPVFMTRDIREVKEQEWIGLFEQILERSIYEAVVLDLGECIQGLFRILSLCDTVYTPYLEEPGAKAKLKQYTENLRRLGYEDVLEHTIRKEQVSG